ncbi:MAG: S8 family serine peptidase [Rhodobacteraceae bacterium]|nr:S8 family serine peptidase [Paracoccaceae bacterium]
MFILRPNDPLYPEQWHFGLIGDIEAIWQDYDGAGVLVGLNDSRPDRFHPELDGNFDLTLSFGPSYDSHGPLMDAHGTAVVGIILAEANDQGGIGLAPRASFGWFSFLYHGDASSLAESVAYDVINNSWGFTPDFDKHKDLSDPDSEGWALNEHLRSAAEMGRGGLGSLSVHAAGNEALNAIGEWFSGSRYTISVAATERDGFAAIYSSHGSSVLLTAPAAALTTDALGENGYVPEDYVRDFGGTSASAPVVTGVIALMLEAAPGLGWRDVKTILALSAGQTGSAPDAAAPAQTEDGLWQSLGNHNWNGGGQLYHVNYGYGMVDVYAAVRMAEAWLTMTKGPATSANETVISASAALDDPVPIAPPIRETPQVTRITIEVTEEIQIETAYLSLQWTHDAARDLTIRLVSPDGYSVMLLNREDFGRPAPGTEYSWTFGIEALRNLPSEGTWTLEVIDHLRRDPGTIDGVELTFHGSPASPDTIHSFTDDFLFLAPLDEGRRLVTDTDGGIDWLNLAAIAGDITADLRSAGQVSVAGVDWFQLARGPASFENLHAGDGDDRLSGNRLDNHLIGGRGQDRVIGHVGADRLEGGEGSDLLRGGSGNDLLLGGAHHDRLRGEGGSDNIDGGRGNDVLTGGAGADHFLFDRAFGSDQITDFQTGQDQLHFSLALTGGLTVARDILARFAQVTDTGLLFDFGPRQQLLLGGVTALDDPAADIRAYDLA